MFALELMTGAKPFAYLPRDLMVIRELDQGRLPERPGHEVTQRGLSNDLWNLLRKCWSKKPDSRPSITTVRMKLAEIRGIRYGVLFRFCAHLRETDKESSQNLYPPRRPLPILPSLPHLR